MCDLTIYHNPRCSKSRQTLELIRSKGVEPEIVLYLEDVPLQRIYGCLADAWHEANGLNQEERSRI